MHNLELTLELFSVLGNRADGFNNSNFKFYLTPYWQTPSFSPNMLLPGKYLSCSDLQDIEIFFEKHPVNNQFLKKTPYFNFFNKPDLYDFSHLKDICARNDWEIDPDPLAINLIQNSIPIKIPKGFYVIIENLSETKMNDEYVHIIKSNFNDDDNYLTKVQLLFQGSRAISFTILIKNNQHIAIAGGTISIFNNLAFLTWGAVNKDYRNQKLHQILLAICKMLALSYNVILCGLTTRNPYIRGKTDEFVEMYICRKREINSNTKNT